jgi:hypothetical protein
MKLIYISKYFWFFLLVTANIAQQDSPISIVLVCGNDGNNSAITSQEVEIDMDVPYFDQHDSSAENKNLPNRIINVTS